MPDNWIPYLFTAADGRSYNFAKEGRYSLKITGQSNINKYAKQHISLSGDAGSSLLVFCSNKTDGSSATGGSINLSIYLNNNDGTKSQSTLSFAKNSHDWITIGRQITATKDFDSADIFVRYNNQKGSTYFDGIKLLNNFSSI